MDAGLRDGIRLFNSGHFFEAHEALEHFYLHTTEEKDKPFVEGLIQLSVAFRLFCDFAEVPGPLRMIRQVLIRLENYQPLYLKIHVNDLISALEEWTRKAQTLASEASIDRQWIPKITIDRASL